MKLFLCMYIATWVIIILNIIHVRLSTTEKFQKKNNERIKEIQENDKFIPGNNAIFLCVGIILIVLPQILLILMINQRLKGYFNE